MAVFWGVLAAIYGVLVGCMSITNINELLYASYLISIFIDYWSADTFLHPCRLGLNLSNITASKYGPPLPSLEVFQVRSSELSTGVMLSYLFLTTWTLPW